MNTFQGVQEQEITNTLSKRQLALWWWVGLIFIWGKGRIWKYFGWNQSVVLKRPNKTDHIIMISFESLSVLLPGQMHINGSKQWHQCLVFQGQGCSCPVSFCSCPCCGALWWCFGFLAISPVPWLYPTPTDLSSFFVSAGFGVLFLSVQQVKH